MTWSPFDGLKRLLGKRQRPQTAASLPPITSLLVEFLTEHISDREKAVSVLESARDYLNSPPERQEADLPWIYLLLEKYIVEFDPHKKLSRAQLRRTVRSRYPDLLNLDRFGLIFRPGHQQAVLLCRLWLQTLFGRSQEVLGVGAGEQLKYALEWCDGIPYEVGQPLPFNLAADVPVLDEQWIPLLRRLVHELFAFVQKPLGQGSASLLFDRCYREMVDAYIGLETFPTIIGLLPDRLLDEQKINLLSRTQMQQTLLEKVAELQQFNEQISRQNLQLEAAQTGLREARDLLEERVRERTFELQQANETIARALREKEVLLREIHHRVKNNLQVICSLQNLQSRNIENAEMLEVFTESSNRVRSMALIHEKLYQSDDLARIDFARYVEVVADNLTQSYGIEATGVTVAVNIADLQLDVEAALPCGLIINELCSNALKYAFPAGRAGQVFIELKERADGYFLTVSDDGVGIPAEVDPMTTKTLGLQIVRALVTQLKGEISVDVKSGTRIEITWQDNSAKPASEE